MTYALQEHVEGELKNVEFSSDSLVSETKLAQILEESDAEIDSYINGRYNLPIVDTKALVFLRKLSIDIVVYRITKILEIKDVRPISDGRITQDISHGSVYRQAINTLKDIRDGEMPLYEAELKTSTAKVKSYNDTNNVEATFKIDEQQW